MSPVAVQQTDKFRIHIYDDGSPDAEVAGKRDILATLHPGRQLTTPGCQKNVQGCDNSKGSRSEHKYSSLGGKLFDLEKDSFKTARFTWEVVHKVG